MERVQNLRELRRREPKITTTLVMRELPQPRETYIHLGGDFPRTAPPLSPAFRRAVASFPAGAKPGWTSRSGWSTPRTRSPAASRSIGSGRSISARASSRPKTISVNQGAGPSHPELLDWLASEFMRRGWSQKAIHRLIVTSATYGSPRPPIGFDGGRSIQQAARSADASAAGSRDHPRFGLAVSGLLTPTIGGPSVYPPIPEGAMAVTQVKRDWPTAQGRIAIAAVCIRSSVARRRTRRWRFSTRRMPSATCTRRVRSDSPLQALTMLNDETSIEFARALAKRLCRIEQPLGIPSESGRGVPFESGPRSKTRGKGPAGTVPRLAARRIQNGCDFGQLAGSEGAGIRFLARRHHSAEDSIDPKQIPELAAWTSVARVLFNLDDFLTRE